MMIPRWKQTAPVDEIIITCEDDANLGVEEDNSVAEMKSLENQGIPLKMELLPDDTSVKDESVVLVQPADLFGIPLTSDIREDDGHFECEDKQSPSIVALHSDIKNTDALNEIEGDWKRPVGEEGASQSCHEQHDTKCMSFEDQASGTGPSAAKPNNNPLPSESSKLDLADKTDQLNQLILLAPSAPGENIAVEQLGQSNQINWTVVVDQSSFSAQLQSAFHPQPCLLPQPDSHSVQRSSPFLSMDEYLSCSSSSQPLPAFAGSQCLQSIFGLQDSSATFAEPLGHISTLPFAAFAIVLTILVRLVSGIMLGMSSATETLRGQAFGARQYHMMCIYLQRSWIVSCGITTILIPLFVFATPVFRTTMQMYLQAQSRNSIIIWFSSGALLLHVVLSWLFVVLASCVLKPMAGHQAFRIIRHYDLLGAVV
ncbi:hypothetical protein MLD38_038949 [Melastoma candidum]|uniref:Uncharacterized protein n=1 Tax=Melastoma candidum TaxID=119954 RepID=A0ACB9L0W7_9MYRT|nr:hypothetical protein MLD38_038949 [Melastoma candidum]